MRKLNLPRHFAASALMTLLLSSAPVMAAGVSVDDASWADTNEATQKYQSGKRAFDQGKLEEALARFRESYDTVASPNSHLMVARVLIELKRYVAAYDELAFVIEEAEAVKKKPEKYAKTADTARALRKELEGKLGFVEVGIPARVLIRGEEVPPSQWGTPLPVVAGTAAVDVELADGKKRTDELAVAAGETSKVDLLPAPTVAAPVVEKREDGCPKQEKVVATKGTVKQTTVGYAAGGVGVAGLLTFTLFGILDNKKFNDVESGCTGLVCPSALADDAERGRSYQALANVGLGVGLAGIGTGAILLLTAPREQNTSARRSRTQLLVGPGTVNVKGAF